MHHFLDVGANEGQTFEYLVARRNEFEGSTIWCFEPSPRSVPRLITRARAMPFKTHICNFGLLRQTRSQRFLMMKTGSTADSFEPALGPAEEEVFAFGQDIVDWITDNIPPDDTFAIKLDCEGSEYEILERLITAPHLVQRITCLLVEFHNIGPDSARRETNLKAQYAGHGVPIQPWLY